MKGQYEIEQTLKKWQDYWNGKDIKIQVTSDWDKVRNFAKVISWGLNND